MGSDTSSFSTPSQHQQEIILNATTNKVGLVKGQGPDPACTEIKATP